MKCNSIGVSITAKCKLSDENGNDYIIHASLHYSEDRLCQNALEQ